MSEPLPTDMTSIDALRSVPFRLSEWRDIGQVIDDLYEKIPRQSKSRKNPFATLPAEIIQNIAASFVPAELAIAPRRRTNLKPIAIGIYPILENEGCEECPKLVLLRVDKRLRDIFLDMMYRRTHVNVNLGPLLWRIFGTFKDSLNYAQQYLEPGFFKNVWNLTCDIDLYPSEVTPGCTRSSSGVVTWHTVFSTELKNNLRDVRYLLALRPPTSVPAQYSIAWASSHEQRYRNLVRGTHDLEILIGSVKTRIRMTFLPATGYWGPPSADKCDRILEAYGRSIDAVIAPMVEKFASNPYASGPSDEVDDQ